MRWSALLVVAELGLAACGGGCSSRTQLPGDGGLVAASCTEGDPTTAGQGTYYSADGTGACSFERSPEDLMVAALNAPDYAGAAWCGACIAVTGPSGSVVVRVVDKCPECKRGDVDLSEPAFAKIAAISAGRVAVSWHEVACPVTGPVAYRSKDGSNADWTAIQVRNHRYAIAKLEAKVGSAYRSIERADDNYFVAPRGLGPGPYALRVTDIHGHVLEDGAIALGDATERAGAAQFPACQ